MQLKVDIGGCAHGWMRHVEVAEFNDLVVVFVMLEMAVDPMPLPIAPYFKLVIGAASVQTGIWAATFVYSIKVEAVILD